MVVNGHGIWQEEIQKENPNYLQKAMEQVKEVIGHIQSILGPKPEKGLLLFPTKVQHEDGYPTVELGIQYSTDSEIALEYAFKAEELAEKLAVEDLREGVSLPVYQVEEVTNIDWSMFDHDMMVACQGIHVEWLPIEEITISDVSQDTIDVPVLKKRGRPSKAELALRQARKPAWTKEENQMSFAFMEMSS